MTIHEALKTVAQAFAKQWPDAVAIRLARELLAGVLELSEASLIACQNIVLDSKIAAQMKRLCVRAQQGEPVAYLLGWKLFLEHRFVVNKYTLIPRHETEHIVRLAAAALTPQSVCVDIGTGSGCIAISLAQQFPQTTVIATDVRAQTLAVAKLNAKRLLTSQNVVFLQTSLLSPTLRKRIRRERPTRVVITANLPYLPPTDRRQLHTSVTAFEPPRALYAADHGNALIKTCLRQLKKLRMELPDSELVALFEFDPPQAKVLLHFAQRPFSDARAEIFSDENDLPRILGLIAPSDPGQKK